jgi:hypothetical protein
MRIGVKDVSAGAGGSSFTGTGGYPSIRQVAKRVARINSHEFRIYNAAINLYSLER